MPNVTIAYGAALGVLCLAGGMAIEWPSVAFVVRSIAVSMFAAVGHIVSWPVSEHTGRRLNAKVEYVVDALWLSAMWDDGLRISTALQHFGIGLLALVVCLALRSILAIHGTSADDVQE